jgi:hypothetical protein
VDDRRARAGRRARDRVQADPNCFLLASAHAEYGPPTAVVGATIITVLAVVVFAAAGTIFAACAYKAKGGDSSNRRFGPPS